MVTVAKGLIVLVAAASFITVSMANWIWDPKSNDTIKKNDTHKIVVGGSEHWHFGFNYSIWASETAPFYVNDVLVFKYDPPNATVPFSHSVYLLPNLWSYLTCDLSNAKMIANITQGGGEGFEFKLKKWLYPYYFACGELNGIHCRYGKMKFMAVPVLRR